LYKKNRDHKKVPKQYEDTDNLQILCQPANLPAVRPGNTNAMTPDFSKVIASSLQNCYSEESSSTAPWSFLLSLASFLSLLFHYKKVRNLQNN